MNNNKIPHDLKLYPFQEETITQALRFFESADVVYIANEQGTGKTPVALCLHNTLKSTRTVIICPSVMKYIWQEEIYRWCRLTPTSLPVVQVVESAKDEFNHAATFVICSYDLSHKYPPLRSLAPDLLIADEAHYLKNPAAKRTKFFFSVIGPDSDRTLLLSGTPMTRNVVDLYAPLHYCVPQEPSFKNFEVFAATYSYSRPSDWGTQYFGLKNHENLSRIMRSTCYIRYRKADVLAQLPPKVYQKITLPSSYAIQPKTSDEEQSYRTVVARLAEGNTIPAPKSLAEHRRLQGEAKVPAIIEYAEELLKQEIPVVIFAHHRNVIDSIVSGLVTEGHRVGEITGDTPAKLRAELVSSFQDGQLDCLVGNFQAMGTGITLTRASNVILAELDWIPATVAQAVDRCHRIGQDANQVTVHYFTVKDSLDETISSILIRRTREIEKVLDNPPTKKESENKVKKPLTFSFERPISTAQGN